MKLLRYLFFTTLIVLTISWFTYSAIPVKQQKGSLTHTTKKFSRGRPDGHRLADKAAEAKAFIEKKGYNEEVVFLLDMKPASGQNRFFVYDLAKDTIQMAGLVTHGNCFQYWLEGRKYSNVVGSGCTSLGKYRVGSSYTGKFGYSYKLHGLDSTNSNAFERTVVLHSHSCVPDSETKDEICQSNGCTTVSPAFLEKLKPILNHSRKPVLLWVFE
ncbi:MAG: murein L,D-transpeptidase catalytic domain family protein [Bacteroidetes bacterium]|nr:murein L,D-transpeptidase catalytic domain family protein [Bacteroidota bacterium]